jgi:hypothetical protein
MVFKLDHIFGGNGSLPSLGGAPSLAAALAGVERAEEMLKAARTVARAAARREGKGIDGLFSESFFIKRSTAEAWSDKSRRAGEKAMADIFTRNLDVDAADENSPFQHLARRLKRPGALQAQQQTPEDLARWHAKMEAAGAFVAMRAGNVEEAARICAELHREEVGKSKAEKIVRAGQRARMSADAAGEVPEPQGLAKQIIEAGKKARRPTGE